MKKIILTSLAGLFLMVGCKKETEDENLEPTANNSKYELIYKDTLNSDLIVELYGNTSLIEVGYTPLYLKIKDFNGAEVKDATVKFNPEMDMGQMQHGSPVIQPVYNSSSKYYEGAIIFTMPSGEMGTWKLEIKVNDEALEFPIEIQNSPQNTKYVGSYAGLDSEKYIVTLIKPFQWKVGMNEISLMIHKKSMHSFEMIEGFSIVIDPQMTSMGHGSPNNVNPVYKGDGYYTGKVNFTMTGDWRINMELKQEGETIVEAAYFDILF